MVLPNNPSFNFSSIDPDLDLVGAGGGSGRDPLSHFRMPDALSQRDAGVLDLEGDALEAPGVGLDPGDRGCSPRRDIAFVDWRRDLIEDVES